MFCLKLFAENFQSLEIFSAESFWSSSLVAPELWSFPCPPFWFFVFFFVSFALFLILLKSPGKVSRKKLNPYLSEVKPHTSRGPSHPQSTPAGEVPSSLPRWLPPSPPAPEEHHLQGGGWMATALMLCDHQVPQGSCCRDPILAWGWGLPSRWDSDGWYMLRPHPRASKTLPVTPGHDPKHTVFW